MAIFKAVKMEVMILTEPSMTNADIIKWTTDAMRDYCDFAESTVKILESHESVFMDPDNEVVA